MPTPGPDINGLYLHPDGTMRRERYDGPSFPWPKHADWTIGDQFRVLFGGEPRTANLRSLRLQPVRILGHEAYVADRRLTQRDVEEIRAAHEKRMKAMG